MNTASPVFNPTPPRLLATLAKGFNIVASHVQLILIPVILDLVLWLGPKLRIKTLLLPVVNDVVDKTLSVAPADMSAIVSSTRTIWEQLLEQLNLFTVIRTFPIGVPSLIARGSSTTSPLAENLILETPSIQVGVAVVGLLLLFGFLLGAFYFNQLSRYSAQPQEKLDWKLFFNQFVQSILLFLILIALALFISIPALLIVSVLSLVSPALGQVIILMVAFLAVWIVMPLIFSPHGIFVMGHKALHSMQFSLRLVRAFLPGTGLFILVSALVSEGFNMLWQLPGTDNWLNFVGIGGHAFIVTALITATFVYYREGVAWMQFTIKRFEASLKQENGGITVDKQ